MNQVDIVVLHFQTHPKTLYTIKGQDSLGQFEVQRRFKDFLSLRNRLQLKWPGCYIPSLPPKKLINQDPKTITHRCKFLNAFCLKLTLLPHIYQSDEVQQLFLRSQEHNIYKQLDSLKNPPIEEILDRLSKTFNLQFDIDDNALKEIDQFAERLKIYTNKLKNIKKAIRDSISSNEQYNNCLKEIITIRLPKFESSFITFFVNKQEILFNNPNLELLEEQKQDTLFTSNNISLLYDLIRLESKDCKVVLKQINDKIAFENKILTLQSKLIDYEKSKEKASSGKLSLKNMLFKKSAQTVAQEKEQQINETNMEIKNTKELVKVINKILIRYEISRYDKERIEQFNDIMETIKQMELENIEKQQKYWNILLNESNRLIQ